MTYIPGVTDDEVSAYVEGGLSAERRQQIDRFAESDAELAAKIKVRRLVAEADGEAVTAMMGKSELKGTIKDGELKLKGKFYADEAGYEAEFAVTGKVDGDKMTGDASWDAYDMTFVATRK